MFKTISMLFIAFAMAISTLNAQNFQWAKSMGGTLDDSGNSIAIDALGNVYTTGSFVGTADFDPGPGTFNLTSSGFSEIFISKFDASGNFVWAKSMEGSIGNSGSSLVLDASGNVYTTGYFQGTVDFDPGAGTFNLISAGGFDIFISKLDNAGNFVWAKSMGGSMEDVGWSIALDASNNIYTTGRFNATVDFDPGAGSFNLSSIGSGDVFISKLDNSGNFVWAKSMGSSGLDNSNCITIDASNNVYTTGIFSGTMDFDPGAGTFNLTSAGGYDIFISKLDNSGDFVWAKSMGGTSTELSRSIAIDATNYVYTTGRYQGTADFDPGAGSFNLTSPSASNFTIFVSKLDASGNFVWAKSMGGTMNDQGASIALDASGNVYSTGSFTGTADFDPGIGTFNPVSAGGADIYISKLDNSGNFVWAKSVGGADDDNSNFITLDAVGDVYITGRFKGTADFDPGVGSYDMTSAGSQDIFLLKLDKSATGILDIISNGSFQIYPNPTNGWLNFSSPCHIQLANLTGQIIVEKKQVTNLDLTDQSSGIYILSLTDNDGQVIQKRKIVKY